MNILVLTDVLPAPILSAKKLENDVLIMTADFHENQKSDVHYTFVFVASYSNFLLSKVSNKWKELQQFRALERYEIRGRKVEIITVPNFKEDGPFKSLLIRIGYHMNRQKLKRLLTHHQIDLVHAHDIKLNAGIAYHLYQDFKVPYVVTSRKLGKLKLGKTLVNYLEMAKAVINLGYSQQRIAEQHNPQSYIVPHGVDNRFLSQQKAYCEDNKLCRGNHPLRLVSLCRLLKWKNIDKVMLALEQLEGDFIYDIYGEGPDEERLQSILATLKIRDRVNFKGHIPYKQVPETLVKYDLFVLPSYREMFGRVYIEAMACGLPVIGARDCGVDGYIQNGVEGFLVNHLDIQALARVIKKFMVEPKLKMTMGKNAKAFSTAFSWKEVIKKIDGIYRQSTGSANGNAGTSKPTVIYVIGVFDLFHKGHIELLKRARALGDKLIVAINSDELVASYKRKPFFSETDRLAMVEACKYVDEAFIIREYDNKAYIKRYGIHVIVHGDDWAKESYLEQIKVDEAFLKANQVSLHLLPYTNGVSTSDLIRKIKES